jgi:nitroreductase
MNVGEVGLALACDHIVLAATAEGLGGCWVCHFHEAPLKELLGIPAELRAVAVGQVTPGPVLTAPPCPSRKAGPGLPPSCGTLCLWFA